MLKQIFDEHLILKLKQVLTILKISKIDQSIIDRLNDVIYTNEIHLEDNDEVIALKDEIVH